MLSKLMSYRIIPFRYVKSQICQMIQFSYFPLNEVSIQSRLYFPKMGTFFQTDYGKILKQMTILGFQNPWKLNLNIQEEISWG